MNRGQTVLLTLLIVGAICLVWIARPRIQLGPATSSHLSQTNGGGTANANAPATDVPVVRLTAAAIDAWAANIETQGPEAVPGVLARITETDPNVKRVAVGALMKIALSEAAHSSGLAVAVIANPGVRTGLLVALNDDKDEQLRIGAASTLAYMYPDETTGSALVQRYNGENFIEVRKTLVQLLAQGLYTSTQVMDVFRDAAASRDEELSGLGAEGVRKIESLP